MKEDYSAIESDLEDFANLIHEKDRRCFASWSRVVAAPPIWCATIKVSYSEHTIILENRHLAAIVTGLGIGDLVEAFVNEALAAMEG